MTADEFAAQLAEIYAQSSAQRAFEDRATREAQRRLVSRLNLPDDERTEWLRRIEAPLAGPTEAFERHIVLPLRAQVAEWLALAPVLHIPIRSVNAQVIRAPNGQPITAVTRCRST